MTLTDRAEQLDVIARWAIGPDTGSSSQVMVAAWLGEPLDYAPTPSDPDDLGRCLRLDAIAPWLRRCPALEAISPQWKSLLSRWDELRLSFLAEGGSLRPERGTPMWRTYRKMQDLGL